MVTISLLHLRLTESGLNEGKCPVCIHCWHAGVTRICLSVMLQKVGLPDKSFDGHMSLHYAMLLNSAKNNVMADGKLVSNFGAHIIKTRKPVNSINQVLLQVFECICRELSSFPNICVSSVLLVRKLLLKLPCTWAESLQLFRAEWSPSRSSHFSATYQVR